MNIKKSMSSILLAALTMVSLQASAGNVSLTQARDAANNFFKQHASSQIKAPAMSDLKLAHAEASKAVKGANDYYAFNVTGGGFIIIAGEDRAPQVLGYSDKGHLDFNKLPYGLQGLLDGYKSEMEFLLTYTEDDLVPVQKAGGLKGVDPLIQTTWGQEDPYDWQCPVQNGQYCVVGCIATAMAQVMYYWKYPEGSDALPRFYSSGYGYVPALPATTFDYSKMLLSYCHWDYDNSELVQDTYTDEQAQEVAKLGRYCGQAADMQYSPNGSGAYTWDQLDAMINFGFRNTAEDVSRSSWWYQEYTDAEWEAMIRTELDAGRPILYSASDINGGGGHAFICDGYNSNNYFHFNYGWYGTCDGWYLSTALNMTHRDGEYLQFNSGHEMLIGIQPPEGWTPPVTVIRGDVNGDKNVNMDDLAALINYLMDNTSPINEANADCDGVNGVNMDDLSDLINYLLTNQW